MAPALRRQLRNVASPSSAAHAGLVLDRYLAMSVKDEGHPDAREALHRAAIAATSATIISMI